MKCLVTGGAGFLGAALANRLVAQGHMVYVLDDLSAGDRHDLGPEVIFNRGDVRDVPRLWSLLAGVDVVYHLAAKVSVPESILYPVEYNAVNTGGTVSVMAACRDAGVGRVIFTSSGTVYGTQAEQPIREAAWPHPANPYAVGKLAAEGYVQAIGQLYRMETVILRIFNAYGPGQAVPPNHPPVIPAFTKQILTGGSVVLHGAPPGDQTRDFVYVDDVVNALLLAGEAPGLAGAVFNIGSGVETRLTDVVTGLERASGRRAAILTAPEQSGGITRLVADISAARSGLGWAPRVDLATGLSRMVAWFAADRARQAVDS